MMGSKLAKAHMSNALGCERWMCGTSIHWSAAVFFLKHNWKLLGLKNKPGKTLSPLCKFGLHLQLHHPVQVLFPEKTKSVVFNPSQIHFIELGFCNQLCNRSEFPKY